MPFDLRRDHRQTQLPPKQSFLPATKYFGSFCLAAGNYLCKPFGAMKVDRSWCLDTQPSRGIAGDDAPDDNR
jgi:hypothetical protein